MRSSRTVGSWGLVRPGVIIGVLCGLAIVLGIASELAASQTKAGSAAQDTATIYKDVYNGWKWWHVYCYRCHGMNAIATTLAPSLIDSGRKPSAKEFLQTVRDGVPDSGMQAWSKLLDDEQIAQIYVYVRARTDKVLPPGRPDEIGPNGGPWVPPAGWPKR